MTINKFVSIAITLLQFRPLATHNWNFATPSLLVSLPQRTLRNSSRFTVSKLHVHQVTPRKKIHSQLPKRFRAEPKLHGYAKPYRMFTMGSSDVCVLGLSCGLIVR